MCAKKPRYYTLHGDSKQKSDKISRGNYYSYAPHNSPVTLAPSQTKARSIVTNTDGYETLNLTTVYFYLHNFTTLLCYPLLLPLPGFYLNNRFQHSLVHGLRVIVTDMVVEQVPIAWAFHSETLHDEGIVVAHNQFQEAIQFRIHTLEIL